ncbi:MAG TPA: Rieske 2Fe-2S domain-containing protein [Solirubrobacterales bacterium]|nr:Rieske 2Fe-2S domain-containing protein [Solirubrobacterales bacterium]
MSTGLAQPKSRESAVICAVEQLPPGTMARGTVGGRDVFVVRGPDGDLFGFHDRCVHQGAPVSRGRLHLATGAKRVGDYHEVVDQTVIKCPWHGYEYELRTGCAMFDPRRRLRKVAVAEVDGRIVASA